MREYACTQHMLTMCRCYVQKEDQDTFRKYIRFSQIELNKKARNPVPEKDLPRIPWIVLPLEGKWLNDYENAYWLFLYRANVSWASDKLSVAYGDERTSKSDPHAGVYVLCRFVFSLALFRAVRVVLRGCVMKCDQCAGIRQRIGCLMHGGRSTTGSRTMFYGCASWAFLTTQSWQ